MKILVVDDCTFSADLVVDILTTHGHEVAVAYGGVEGLAALSLSSVDVVLLDLRMPELDGYQVLNKLRSSDLHSAAKIVAFTGCTDHDAIVKMQECGFDRILIKPISVGAILNSLGARTVVS